MKRFFLLTAIVAVALSSVAHAQQQPALQPTASPKNKAEQPTTLLLEIVSHPEFPPAYLSVPGPDAKPTWSWFARFGRLPGSQSEPSIRAVKLEAKYNGETADVRVSLLRGAFDREDLVGVYHVGIGEQKTLNDLRAVGVEPFSIKLLNTVPPLPPQPLFENHTKSIDIVSVQLENMPKPAYRVIFRNLSDKNLSALRVDVTRDGRPGTSSLISGEEGRPAIEAGGILERYMGVESAQQTPTGYVPGTAAAHTIIIRTAVFADMSFEGELQSACLFESSVMARRLWLRRVLALLNRELAKPANEDQIEAARQFKEKLAALQFEFDESDRLQTSVVSPDCPKPFDVARTSPAALKLQVLRELDEIIDKPPAPSVNFRLWLETRRGHYIAWLTRL
jgi:hypothetical protein